MDKLASVGALYQPNNDFYQPLYQPLALDDQPESESMVAPLAPSSITDTDVAISDDVELIYQQLILWLSHPKVAKQAGQAGEQMTVQQQEVLTRQLKMIEETIEYFVDAQN